ncbi:MAG: AAA family ATPase [Saezia sp.]
MLPPPVKTDLAFTVVILGTESTGKTTLTHRLAQHYHATSVDEVGRELIQNSNHFEHSTLLTIATEHAKSIIKGKQAHAPLVIVDTDIHITASYAQFCFAHAIPISPAIKKANRANLYLYLDKDAPFVQDGTRFEETQRDLLDNSHKETLRQHSTPYHLIQGDWENRFQQACAILDAQLKKHIPWQFRITNSIATPWA